ncbi:MAG: ferritin family protein [Candidatus Omnitrophota bacterium]
MGNIFLGSEIVELGIQIEQNGRDFYDMLARETRVEKAAALFKHLKGEEEKHIGVFGAILARLAGYEPAEAYPGEYTSYMKALAASCIFTQKGRGAEAARRVQNELEALDLGIGFEKDSIIFYEGMKKVVPPHEVKAVEELVRQEENHLRQLSELKEALS